MKPGDWTTISQIAERALALAGDERERYIEDAAAEHPDLGHQIRQLCAATEGADEYAASLGQRLAGAFDGGSFLVGESFGAYRVEGVLGWGGMGAVYRARRADDQYDKTVALKVLPAGLADEASTARFLDERQILARLEHPAIARLVDGGVTPAGQPFFALEYIEGVAIDEFADPPEVELPEILAVFSQICDAVAYAHAQLVTHCDIKPSNILVDVDGRARLLDFGIARVRAGDDGTPPLGYLDTPLTRNYASPELLAGRRVDARTDVYSLGNLLHRLVTGEQRYDLAPGATVPAEGSDLRGPKLSRASPVTRAELRTIIARATAPDPDARYGSAAQLAAELRRVGDHEPLAADRVPVAFYRLRKFARRNPLAAALGAVVVATVVTAVAGLTYALVESWDQQRVAEAARARAERASATSDEVIEYLVAVFDQGDPSLRDAGDEASPRELVETGLRQLEGIDDTAVRARLGLALGRVGLGIGALPEARKALEAAHSGPLNDEERRHVRLYTALVDHMEARADADDALRVAANDCQTAGDVACAVTALRTRGRAMGLAGDHEGARAVFERALGLLPAEGSHTLRALTLHDLAIVEHRSRRYDAAMKLFEEVIELYRDIDSEASHVQAAAYQQLGTHRHAMGDHRAARDLLQQARALTVELRGPHHPDVAEIDHKLSFAHQELGDLERALARAKSSLSIRQERLGEDHARTGMSWSRLGQVLWYLGRREDGIEALTRGRDLARAGSKVSYANQGLFLASALAGLGRHDEALALTRESMAIHAGLFGDDHVMMARSHRTLGEVLALAGDLARASAAYREALALSAPLREDHPRRPRLLLEIGRLEARQGRAQAARATLARAAELAAVMRPQDPDLAEDIERARGSSTSSR